MDTLNKEQKKRWDEALYASKGHTMNKVAKILISKTDASTEDVVRLTAHLGKDTFEDERPRQHRIDYRFTKERRNRSHTRSWERQQNRFDARQYETDKFDMANHWLFKHINTDVFPIDSIQRSINCYSDVQAVLDRSHYNYNSARSEYIRTLLAFSKQFDTTDVNADNVLSSEELNRIKNKSDLSLLDKTAERFCYSTIAKSKIKRYACTPGMTAENRNEVIQNARKDMMTAALIEAYLQALAPENLKQAPYKQSSLTGTVYEFRPNDDYRISLYAALDCLRKMDVTVVSKTISDNMYTGAARAKGMKQKLFRTIMSSYGMFNKAKADERGIVREVLVDRLNNVSNDFCDGYWVFAPCVDAEEQDEKFLASQPKQKKSEQKTKKVSTRSTGKLPTFVWVNPTETEGEE